MKFLGKIEGRECEMEATSPDDGGMVAIWVEGRRVLEIPHSTIVEISDILDDGMMTREEIRAKVFSEQTEDFKIMSAVIHTKIKEGEKDGGRRGAPPARPRLSVVR